MIDFESKLWESGYVHNPLNYRPEDSFEALREQVKVLETKTLWSGDKVLTGETVTSCWPEGMPSDGDYAFYGTVDMKLDLEAANLEKFDRLRLLILPECDGTYVTEVTVSLKNDGAQKVPDAYGREGSHVLSLKNHETNERTWEFGSMPRDCVTEIGFSFRKNGREASGGEKIVYHVLKVTLEKTEKPYKDLGWECEENSISYATTGYFTGGIKQAVTRIKSDVFYVVSDDTGVCVYQGEPKQILFGGKEYYVLDFSEVTTPGRFHVRIGEVRTPMFVIDERIFEQATWKTINFLFSERCGYPVRGRHGICHMDVVARHNGKILPFCGGWHDAGDLSQQMTHTAETADALLSVAFAKGGKENAMLHNRLVEEAIWGLEFLLRTRFEDGYRGTSAGLVRWTKGFIGDGDDVEARVHNHAMENLLSACVLAKAALYLAEEEKDLAFRAKKAAKEDFAFGLERLKTHGQELPIFWEHTYGLSLSQCYALVVLAASRLYELTGEETYRESGKDSLKKLLECQETEETSPVYGCFYRKVGEKSLIHATHQSREYLCVEALAEAANFLSEDGLKKEVDLAIRRYGAYLKSLMEHANPYNMFPAGIYHEAEIERKEEFELLHLLTDYETEKAHYKKQLEAGENLGNGYYLRQFPVWFSFRGNGAIHLALGRAAALVGQSLRDETYLDMAREQLYWMNGKNPFEQSLQYGEGLNYAVQYAPLPGEMIGEMPVGVQTKEDGDEPYWPHTNNATYKEVWTSTANRWLWVLAAVMEGVQEHD